MEERYEIPVGSVYFPLWRANMSGQLSQVGCQVSSFGVEKNQKRMTASILKQAPNT